MRLLKKHTDILKGLVKGKGIYKTKLIPKDKSIKEMEREAESKRTATLFRNVSMEKWFQDGGWKSGRCPRCCPLQWLK